MANHKSAKKRTRQSIKRNQVNKSLSSKIKNSINNFNNAILSKTASKKEDLYQRLSIVNSALSKAVKKGLIKKEFASRKLSSLSNQIKKN